MESILCPTLLNLIGTQFDFKWCFKKVGKLIKLHSYISEIKMTFFFTSNNNITTLKIGSIFKGTININNYVNNKLFFKM